MKEATRKLLKNKHYNKNMSSKHFDSFIFETELAKHNFPGRLILLLKQCHFCTE